MQQQQQGGTQYGVPPPDMAPFASPGAAPRAHMLGFPSGADHQQQHPPPLAEAASPISSRPPASRQIFDELVSAAVPANFADDDALAAGEEVERGGMAGNRWPRQETLALLKIRSDMDAAFRDANLKGPLWEDVSRKLAELGYTRSAKKCKEKFENVHKYYKRTKEGRAGRQDGKSYRFFTQLEALHSGATSSTTSTPNPNPTPISTAMTSPTATVPVLPTAPVPNANLTPPPTTTTTFATSSTMPGPSSATTRVQLPPVPAPTPTPTITPPRDLQTPIPTQPLISSSAPAAAAAGISFSSDTFSSSESETDDEVGDASRESRKRKRGGESGGSGKMMVFFEGLMKQVMERQEAMQQRFLETIEKREQDRMIREEAWKRQEMARLNREHELLAQERAMAATRDAAVISFLQKISGQPIQMPPPVTVRAASPPQPSPPPPPPSQQQHHPPPSQQQHPPTQQPQKAPAQSLQPQVQPHQELQLQRQSTEIVRVSSSTELVPVPVPEPHEVVATGAFEGMSSSSRWPKSEVHVLIKLRSGLEGRYQEAGPKGPLWEEISQGMQRLGYSRSAKRCKEKWENINKYFKKVKESNKKRPEDAKTCPYFHQLDALYRKKLFGNQRHQEPETNPNSDLQERRMALPPAPQQRPHPETEGKNGDPEGGGSSTSVQIQSSNGGPQPSFGAITMKKPEDIVKELMEQQHQQASMDDYDKMEEHESDNIDGDDDDDDGHDDEERTMQYKKQFQGQNVVGGGGNASAKAPSAATAGSFLAMVQ